VSFLLAAFHIYLSILTSQNFFNRYLYAHARRDLAGSTCCHLTTRERNARSWRIHVHAGQREPKRGGCWSPRVTRPPQTPPPPLPLRAASHRAAPSFRVVLWRGRLDATSREYLTPVVPSASASRGPMARRRRHRRHRRRRRRRRRCRCRCRCRRRHHRHRHYRHRRRRRRRRHYYPTTAITTATADPYSTSPCCILPTRVRAHSLARSLALACRQSRRSPSVPSPRPRSFSRRHLFRRMSPKSPLSPPLLRLPRTLSFSLSLSLALSASLLGSTPGGLVPISSRSLSLSLSFSLFATPGVSRCLDAALR